MKLEKIRNNNFTNFAVTASLILATSFVAVNLFPVALAASSSQATAVIEALVSVLTLICSVVGAIMALVGFIKVIMAHADSNGPEQNKAAMMIGSGIALILLGPLLKTLNVASWIS